MPLSPFSSPFIAKYGETLQPVTSLYSLSFRTKILLDFLPDEYALSRIFTLVGLHLTMYNTSKRVPACKGRFTRTNHEFRLGTVFSTTTLSHIAQLLSELELLGCCACGENLFQISPSILRCSHIPNVTQELFPHTGREVVQNFAHRLFLGREVSMCRFGCYIIRSVDISPVSMP